MGIFLGIFSAFFFHISSHHYFVVVSLSVIIFKVTGLNIEHCGAEFNVIMGQFKILLL